jgi:hypothetical protein
LIPNFIFKGPWAQFELGKLSPEEFEEKFSTILKTMTEKTINVESLLDGMHNSSFTKPYPEILDAIKVIRAQGLKTALVTNNWFMRNGKTFMPVDCKHFDVVCLHGNIILLKYRVHEPAHILVL